MYPFVTIQYKESQAKAHRETYNTLQALIIKHDLDKCYWWQFKPNIIHIPWIKDNIFTQLKQKHLQLTNI